MSGYRLELLPKWRLAGGDQKKISSGAYRVPVKSNSYVMGILVALALSPDGEVHVYTDGETEPAQLRKKPHMRPFEMEPNDEQKLLGGRVLSGDKGVIPKNVVTPTRSGGYRLGSQSTDSDIRRLDEVRSPKQFRAWLRDVGEPDKPLAWAPTKIDQLVTDRCHAALHALEKKEAKLPREDFGPLGIFISYWLEHKWQDLMERMADFAPLGHGAPSDLDTTVVTEHSGRPDFVAREWVFEAISVWLAQAKPVHPGFVISGKPDRGKTAILDELARRIEAAPASGVTLLASIDCRARAEQDLRDALHERVRLGPDEGVPPGQDLELLLKRAAKLDDRVVVLLDAPERLREGGSSVMAKLTAAPLDHEDRRVRVIAATSAPHLVRPEMPGVDLDAGTVRGMQVESKPDVEHDFSRYAHRVLRCRPLDDVERSLAEADGDYATLREQAKLGSSSPDTALDDALALVREDPAGRSIAGLLVAAGDAGLPLEVIAAAAKRVRISPERARSLCEGTLGKVVTSPTALVDPYVLRWRRLRERLETDGVVDHRTLAELFLAGGSTRAEVVEYLADNGVRHAKKSQTVGGLGERIRDPDWIERRWRDRAGLLGDLASARGLGRRVGEGRSGLEHRRSPGRGGGCPGAGGGAGRRRMARAPPRGPLAAWRSCRADRTDRHVGDGANVRPGGAAPLP